MAVTEYHVMYGVQHGGGGIAGFKEYSKAEAEAIDPKITEKVEVFGPQYTAKFITVKAETAAMAARFVTRQIAGFGSVTGVFSKATELNKGTASKSAPTVKTTEWLEEAVI